MRRFNIHWIRPVEDVAEGEDNPQIIEGVRFDDGSIVYDWTDPDCFEYVTIAKEEQEIYQRFKAYGPGHSISIEWIDSEVSIK